MNIFVHIAWWIYAYISLTHIHQGVELLDHRVYISLALVENAQTVFWEGSFDGRCTGGPLFAPLDQFSAFLCHTLCPESS